jgi:hypothetical protein
MFTIAGLFKRNQTEDEPLRLIFDERRHVEIELNRGIEDIRRRLHDIDSSLVSMRENGASEDEIAAMQQEEYRLWLMVRRFQASLRSTPDLEREYKEWMTLASPFALGCTRAAGDSEDETRKRAAVRAEIVASELRLRGVGVESMSKSSFEEGARDASPDAIRQTLDVNLKDEEDQNAAFIVWDQGNADDVLAEIEQTKSDLRRIEHAEGDDDRDAYEALKSLRHHHAALRLMDRAEGRRRVRIF